jgi:hypothetical protein
MKPVKTVIFKVFDDDFRAYEKLRVPVHGEESIELALQHVIGLLHQACPEKERTFVRVARNQYNVFHKVAEA